MSNSTITRFPNGIATNEIQQNLGNYVLPDITKVHTKFDDFDITFVDLVDWQRVGTGTAAVSDGDNGIIVLTNTGSDNALEQILDVRETFLFETGKQLWFKSKFLVNDATQSQLVVGLQTRTGNSDATIRDDGVFFRKNDADATLQFVVAKDSIETVTDVLEMSNSTFVTVGFYYDGIDKISIFSDNEGIAKSVTTNLPDDEVLGRVICIKNGEAVSKVLSADYILASKEK